MTLQNGPADERRNARWNRLSHIAMAVGFGMLVAANVLLSFVFSGFFDVATLTDPQGNTVVAPTATEEITVWLDPTSTAPTATEETAPTAEPAPTEEPAPTTEPALTEEPAPTAKPPPTEEAAPTTEPAQDTDADGMLPTLGSGPGRDATSLRQYVALGFLALSGFALIGTTLLVRRRVSGA